MTAGFDTGYFVRLFERNETAVSVWQDLTDGKIDAIVNPLTLFELKKLSLKGHLKMDHMDILLEAVEGMCRVAWINRSEMVYSGAAISHGTGIPTVDAIIIAGFVQEGVDVIYTTDSHFKTYMNKSIEVIVLNVSD